MMMNLLFDYFAVIDCISLHYSDLLDDQIM